MAMPPPNRFHWTIFWFLCGFIVLLVVISYWWLIPGLAAAADASPVRKNQLALLSLLLMLMLLTIIGSAMVLLFGVAKRVFPRKDALRSTTTYSDAWAEAGRRARVPRPEDSSPDHSPDQP